MQSVAAFFASIITFVSGLFGSPLLATNSPINDPAAQPAAAAVSQTEIASNPFTDPAAAAANVAAPMPAFPPPPAPTVIGQPVTERIVERIVPQGGAISAETLAAILADFEQSISSRISAINPAKAAIPEQVAAAGNAAVSYFPPASQRIDQLTNTSINNPSISGGSISDASSIGASGGSFDTLSAGTLNLSGALTGTDATFSGTLSAGTLNVAGLSSQSALIGPYFSATSTTATSTFAGSLTAANGSFSILQNGNVGIGTTTPSAAPTVQGSGIDAWGFYKQYGNNALYSSSTDITLAVGAPQAAAWMAASSSPSWQSVAIGAGALAAMPIGGVGAYNLNNTNNVAIGVNALTAANAGYDNVAVGWNAAAGITTENRSVAVGSGAFRYGNGHAQTAVGFRALYGGDAGVGVSGTDNTAIGAVALYNNTTGADNTAVGAHSAEFTTTGSYNTSVGFNSLSWNTTGSFNTVSGFGALYSNMTGSHNVAYGYAAGIGVIGASDVSNNSFFGDSSGFNIRTGGNNNTLVGYQAGYDITTGQYNTILGTQTAGGTGITTGSNNILLGQDLRAGLSQTGSNQLNIGNLIFGTGLSSGASLSSCNVGIGTTTPTAQLHTTGTVRFSNFGAGTLTTDASGNVSVSSDERLKNVDGAFTRGLADIVKLSPISYHWNPLSGLDTGTQYAGFSAQNVQQAIPEAVGSSTSGYLTLQDRPLIAAAINAIKELSAKLDTLKGAMSSFAERFTTRHLCVEKSDGTPVCVTGDQLAAILAAAGQTTGSPSTNAPAGVPQAPVLELNGNASSTVELGSAYNDLGARIVAPESELNLGVIILLDDATTTAVPIDTSTPGEHTILYTVTSPTSGLTSNIMRTVTVSPATQSSEPPANDNASTTLPLAI